MGYTLLDQKNYSHISNYYSGGKIVVSFGLVSYTTIVLMEIFSFLYSKNLISSTVSHIPLLLFVVVIINFKMFQMVRPDYKPVDPPFRNLQILLFVYLAFAFINHVFVNSRPETFLSVFAGWGVIWLISRPIELPNIYKFVVRFVLLMSLVSIAAYLSGNATASVIITNMKVNLSYVDQKHFTGALGFFLLVLTIDRKIRLKDMRHILFWIAVIFSTYVILFSNRGYLLGAVFFIISYLLFYRIKSKIIATVAPVVLIIFFIVIPVLNPYLLQSINLGGLNSLLGFDREAGADVYNDVTSGRTWLWLKHWSMFQDNWVYGMGDFRLEDYVNSIFDYKRADSESFFTVMLVRDGILGFLNIVIFMIMIFNAHVRKNQFGYALAVSLIVLSALLGIATNFYDPKALLLYLLYFASFSSRFNLTNTAR